MRTTLRTSVAVAIAICVAVALVGCSPSAQSGSKSSGDNAAQPTRIASTDAQRQEALVEWYRGMYRGNTRFGAMCIKRRHDTDAHQYCQTVTAHSVFYVDHRGVSVTVKMSQMFSDQAPYPLVAAYENTEVDDKPKHSKRLHRVDDRYERSIDGVTDDVEIDYTFDDVLTGDIWLKAGRHPNDTLCMRTLWNDMQTTTVDLRVLADPPNMLDGKVVTSAYEMLMKGTCWRCYASGSDLLLEVSPDFEMRYETAEQFAAGQLNAIPVGAPVTATGKISGIADVSSMTVRVRGDLAAQLSDGAGQTVQHLTDHEALVTIDQHAVPAAEGDRQKYLKQDPLAPELQPLVAEVRGMSLPASGPRRAAALIDVVHRHLRPDLAAQGSSLASAVAKGRGVCLHFAGLFEVLARAADLPARTVAGLASGGDNQFAAHEWVEILYDGRWHSIDPTFRMLKAPAHIQFANGFFNQDTQIEVVKVSRGVDHWSMLGAAAAVVIALAVALGIWLSSVRRTRYQQRTSLQPVADSQPQIKQENSESDVAAALAASPPPETDWLLWLFSRGVYTAAAVIALWPVFSLGIDPHDPVGNHVIRFIACPIVGLVLAAAGKLLMLLFDFLLMRLHGTSPGPAKPSLSLARLAGFSAWLILVAYFAGFFADRLSLDRSDTGPMRASRPLILKADSDEELVDLEPVHAGSPATLAPPVMAESPDSE